MKICSPVSEKPQVKISLPSVKTHLSARAGIFFKTTFRGNRQNFGFELAGVGQTSGFGFGSHSEALQWVCNGFLFSVSTVISAIHSIFKMSASRNPAGYLAPLNPESSRALAPLFCGG